MTAVLAVVTGLAMVAPAMTARAATADAAVAVPRPVVRSVSPSAGIPSGGTTVTVTGSGFLKITKVTFGGIAGTHLKVLSATKLTVITPKHPAGAVDVRVHGGNGVSAVVGRDRFAYLASPRAPFVESVTATGLGVLAAWAPPAATDKVQAVAVTARPAAGAPPGCPVKAVTVPTSDTQSLVGGLCAGIVYTVTAKARNAAAYSVASPASAPVVPLSAQVPGVPLITSVVSRSRSLVVVWAPPADNGGRPVTGYTITASGGSSSAVTVKAAAAAGSATVTGLTNGAAYAVSLTASNAVGTSQAASGSGTPAAAHAPAAPGGLTVVPDGKGRLVASWTASADNGGSPVTQYTITYQRATLSGGTGQWTPVPGATVHRLPARASALTATAATFEVQKAFYLFSIAAANAIGRSPAATQAAAVTPAVTVGPHVAVLSAATVTALSAVSPAALAWEDPAPVQARKLAPGQTIVAAPGALLPQGTLRTVVSVSDKGGTLTVATQPGRLADAFAAMGVDTMVNPVTGAARSGTARSAAATVPRFVPSVAGVRMLPAAGGGVGFGDSVTLSVDLKAGHVAVEAEVSLTASIDVSLDVHHGFAGIPNGVSVSASAKVTAALGGTVKVEDPRIWSTQIGEIAGPPIDIQVGPVPVVIVPTVPVFLALSGSGGLGIEVRGTIGGAVVWSSANPARLQTRNLSSGPVVDGRVVPGLTVTGELDFGLQVQPQADVYDAAGPNVEADIEDSAQVDFNPAPGDPFLSIGQKLQLKAGVDLDLFRVHASLEATIGSFTFGSFTIDTPPSASYTITPANPSVGAGGTLTLTATRSDGATEDLTWGLLGGTRSDSISSGGVLRVSGPAGRTLTVTVSDASGAAGQATVTVGIPFDSPSSVVATQHSTNSGADVSWTAPGNTGGSALARYTVVTVPPTGTHTVTANVTSLTLPSLAPGSYAVSVYATNKAGAVSPPGTATLTISGAALTFDHTQNVLGASDRPDDVSCPTTTFCLVVGYFGGVTIYRSGLWTAGPSLQGVVVPSAACVSPTFCVVTYEPEASTGARAVIFNGTRWSAPVVIDASTWVTSLSCATRTFCEAIDWNGRVIRFNGSGWSKPATILPGSDGTPSISCASSSACLAVNGGEWTRYQGTNWSAEKPTGRNVAITALSCATASYCMAIGSDSSGKTSDGEAVAFSGSAWSAPMVVNSGGGFGDSVQSPEDLSCRSASSCMAADVSGADYKFDGKTWHDGSAAGPNSIGNGSRVACASVAWCATAGEDYPGADVAAIWTPAGWSKTAVLNAAMYDMSCVSTVFCVATGNDVLDQTLAVASVFNGSRWSTPILVDRTGAQAPVSCPSTAFCMLVDYGGSAVTYDHGAWSPPRPLVTKDFLMSVSCPSSSFCVAVTRDGYALTYNGTGWSSPKLIDSLSNAFAAGGLTSVSCPATTFCVAGDVLGRTATYVSGTWSATPTAVPGLAYVSSLSCVSASFCVAVGSSGSAGSALAAARFDGTSWFPLPAPGQPGNQYYLDVSCTSASFCALAGTQDSPMVFENGAWSSAFMPQTMFTDTISCAGNDWCATVGWPGSPGTMLWSDQPR